MSVLCEKCGHQFDEKPQEEIQVCPKCGSPITSTSDSMSTSDDIAESVITDAAGFILKWGTILSKALPGCIIIYVFFRIVSGIREDNFDNTAMWICNLSLVVAVILHFVILYTTKITWAGIMLFVNISTTLKRIEIKLEDKSGIQAK